MKTLLTALTALTIVTPLAANAGGLASDYRSENEGNSLEYMCKEVQTMFITTGQVPLYSYTQKREHKNGVTIDYKMIKNGKVYSGGEVGLYNDGRPPYKTDCGYIREIATLGQETSKYNVSCNGLGCGDYTTRNLWTMENNKLVHYHQWANRPVERQVWN